MEEIAVAMASMPTPLPWQWIVEKLVDNKEIETPLLKAMIMLVPDIQSPSCSSLQRRIALRYLEEILFTGKFEAHAVPLLKVFINSTLQNSTSADDLFLRICTEVVLGHIREVNEDGERDWERFEEDLKQVFTEDILLPPFISRRNELLGLLKDKSTHLSTLEKYPIDVLKSDLLHFVREKKACLDKTVLDQLVCDINDGRYTCTFSPNSTHALPRVKECINSVHRKRFLREATSECENSSEGQKRLRHSGNDLSPSHVENIKECIMARYNVSDNNVQKTNTLGTETGNLHKDQQNTNNSSDMGGRQELHCNGDKEILQASSGTESTNNISNLNCDERTDNEVHGLEQQISGPDEENNSDTEARKEEHILHAEELPELYHLLPGNDCPGQSCFKCRKGGALSYCDGCSVSVHDNCLQSDVSIASGESVCCPVCSYKRALAAYKTAKKEALESKKRLLAFMGIEAVQGNGQKPLDRFEGTKEILPDIGNLSKDPSSHANAFNLDSKKRPLPLRTRSSKIPVLENEIPDGTGNDEQLMQTDAHDDRVDEGLEESHEDDRKYRFRIRKSPMRGNFRLPGARRIKLPWTKAEEDILKEAMQKFSPFEANNIPWKRILEHGKGIFHKSRLAGDLKDKWRNLKKAVPEACISTS
ncbi:hypothetical protein KI387_026341 [Taxus chinensis]|uniref:Myb-like domain-containing protein n=1 Tax=Taxus chinensis TaxID=29808 RepID=A0AA38FVT5_TAXCH|nr:hypothetical protein KI387_026341 [Taxus chinensis]